MEQKTLGSLLVLEPWYGAGTFHCLKGTSNIFSFQETADWAWPCLGFTSLEKWQRASSYKEGRMTIAQTKENKRLVASWLLCTFTYVYRLHPQGLCSGKPPLPLSHIDFSYVYGKDTIVLPLPLWTLVCCREFPWLERTCKSVLCRGGVRCALKRPSFT